MTDKVLMEDLDYLAGTNIIKEFNSSCVMVTGASGLIGSQIVKAFLTANKKFSMDIKVIALVRDINKSRQVFKDYESDKLIFFEHDICDIIDENIKVDYIFHLASATSSKFFIEKPVETINTAINGSKNVLEFAKKNHCKGVVYLSSLEVYGVTNPKLPTVNEDEYGYIDILNTRSSYSESKKMVECMCASYAAEYGVNVKIARLGQTFGPGVDYNDQRVFAQFARSIIENKDIILHTKGNTIRNYGYIADSVEALFYIMLKGNKAEAYNVVNEDTDISIRNMAQMLIDYYKETNTKLIIETKDNINYGYNPEVKIKLDTSKLRDLGWKPRTSLIEMFTRMIESMKLYGKK